jgi:general stress protein YciG
MLALSPFTFHVDANVMQRDIASQGGQASSGSFQPGDPRAREAGRKGGKATGTTEPEE